MRNRKTYKCGIALLATLLTACAYSGPVADGVSTEIALAANSSAMEINPLGGHPAIRAVGLVAKTAIIRHQRGKPLCTTAVASIGGLGWFAAGNNMAVALSAGSSIALPIGLVTGLAYLYATADERREWCYPSCSLNDLPQGAKGATCERGRVVLASG